MMQTEDIRRIAEEFTRMRQEYAYNGTIFDKDGPKVRAAKLALSRLDVADQAIFILYAELGSIRKLGELLGISRGCAHKEIKRIRQELMERMK